MSARFRPLAPLLGLLAAAGCSLLCTFNGLKQVCDSEGDCLAGYSCIGGECVAAAGGDGGGQGAGCTSDDGCLAGACVGGACNDLPMAWFSGGAQSADLACYPWPGHAVAGNPLVSLTGCIVTFPGDSFAKDLVDAGATVQLFEGVQALSPQPVPVVAKASCASGIGYSIPAPPGQLFEAVVTAQGCTPTSNGALELPADAGSGVRDLGVLSANGWSQELGSVSKAVGLLGVNAEDALEVGIVRDCNGNPLSGIALDSSPQPDGGAIEFAYLDSSGAPVAGRTATSSSGLFAAIALPGSYPLEFVASTGSGSEALASFPLLVSENGSGWIDLSPFGP